MALFAAVDIRHVGSAVIHSIYAKPIIDIVIGLRDSNEISPYVKRLEELPIVDTIKLQQ